MVNKPLTVVFFQRKPRAFGNFSLEFIFNGVRKNLPPHVKCITAISKYESNGVWKRIYTIFEASKRQGDVNHVTGDVHFLTYLLKKQKTVLTILDCGFMQHPSAIARLILKLFWLIIPVKRSSVITVISEATKEELLKYISCEPVKIKVIPVFISPNYSASFKLFNSAKPTLLQIGTAHNKNISRLMEALSGIPCFLEIIGKLSPEHIALLNQYNISYNNSYNLTEQEIIAAYQRCDMLTFVSTYEGFGMPILEAQTVERPVVTSNILSMPEVAGEGACLVDPLNVASIRQGILKVIQDEPYRNRLIEKGRKNIQRFQVETIARQYLDIYESLHRKYS